MENKPIPENLQKKSEKLMDLNGQILIKNNIVFNSKIEDFQKIAKERGGKCLSEKYINTNTKLEFECAKGHRWFATPHNIKHGTWSPICYQNENAPKIEDFQKIAEERGGICLSKKYINSRTKLEWECEKGHKWKATPKNIKNGRWCPKCAKDNQKSIIKEIQQIAIKRGGKCLSVNYINARMKLGWECIKGHRWFATPDNVKRGTWCPKCAIENLKKPK
ncbi:MAG: zinc-ribbon domain-containing protein [Promethearchaeota archaeon]